MSRRGLGGPEKGLQSVMFHRQLLLTHAPSGASATSPGRKTFLTTAVPSMDRDATLPARAWPLLDSTTRSCCAKAPASTIWPRLPCRDRGGGPMCAQPTAATAARWGAISATTLARSCCCCSFPARSGALLSSILAGREQVFQEIGASLCGLFSFIVMFLVLPPSGSA
jgi:hypothetical protein